MREQIDRPLSPLTHPGQPNALLVSEHRVGVAVVPGEVRWTRPTKMSAGGLICTFLTRWRNLGPELRRQKYSIKEYLEQEPPSESRCKRVRGAVGCWAHPGDRGEGSSAFLVTFPASSFDRDRGHGTRAGCALFHLCLTHCLLPRLLCVCQGYQRDFPGCSWGRVAVGDHNGGAALA